MNKINELDKSRLLEAISRAQADYITQNDTRKTFDALLVSLLSVTGSEYGYIGEVLVTQDGKPYLRTHAISNIAWNDETRKFYEENAPQGLEFYNLKSLFGCVLEKQEVVIANDPMNDARACGLPPGHPDLNAFLGLPFITKGEIVGSAGISNREGGYDEEVVEFLKPLMATCANILFAEKVRKEKAHHEKLQNDFLSIISHELRTPMTSIRGSLGLLETLYKDQLDKSAGEIIDAASNGCKRMLRLLDDILDIQKLESGTMKIQLGDCDLQEIVQKICSEFADEAAHKGLQLITDIPSVVTMRADSDRIEQVIANLVSNALKFTDSGSVGIRIRDVGDSILIKVEDTGRGISKDELEHIFEKFHQVGEVNTRTSEGVGLGLYIVHSIVIQHGGKVNVESETDKGTKFTIEFPKNWTKLT